MTPYTAPSGSPGHQTAWTLSSKLKAYLYQLSTLAKPDFGNAMYVYLAANNRAISNVLAKEVGLDQHLIYFTSKVLQGTELNYSMVEKVAFTLIITSRCLCPYFQAHPIIVRSDQPLKAIL